MHTFLIEYWRRRDSGMCTLWKDLTLIWTLVGTIWSNMSISGHNMINQQELYPIVRWPVTWWRGICFWIPQLNIILWNHCGLWHDEKATCFCTIKHISFVIPLGWLYCLQHNFYLLLAHFNTRQNGFFITTLSQELN